MARSFVALGSRQVGLGALLAVGLGLGALACGGSEATDPATGGSVAAGGSGGAGLAPVGGSGGTTTTTPNGGSGGEGAGSGLNVSQLAIGTPTFEVVGFQLFSAPMGTLTDEFAQRPVTLENTLPHHEWISTVELLAPQDVEAPPYDQELPTGVLGAGYENKSTFALAEWTAPQGLYLGAMIVPAAGAPEGSSPDFEDGAIVATTQFPISVDLDLWKGGAVLDTDFDFDYPTVDELVPELTVDGYSHMPLVFWRNSDIIDGQPDTYQFRLRVTDASGAGWQVFVPFFVE